jgi:hypothetical protein
LSLSTYSGLQTAIINALHRADLSAAVPDFITLAEDKLNKRLRLRAMENRATASVSSEYTALPTGFLSLRNIQLNTDPVRRLEYATPEWVDATYKGQSGIPRFYTMIGGEIQLAPPPDGTYTVEIDYYKKLDLAADLTNWLLTNAPRCYYYGALMEAAAYLVNDKRVPMWEQLLESAIREVEVADQKDVYPTTGMQMRLA